MVALASLLRASVPVSGAINDGLGAVPRAVFGAELVPTQRPEPRPADPTPGARSPKPHDAVELVGEASWYGLTPAGCYGPGYTPHPPGLTVFTAHRSLPCGTELEIRGPQGTIRATVRDRGPYVAGRVLDLSKPAFVAVCGPAHRGVCQVRAVVVRS